MSDQKPIEIWVCTEMGWIEFEQPSAQDLANYNWYHTIQKSAYDEKNRRLIETNGFLHDRAMEAKQLRADLDLAIEALKKILTCENMDWPRQSVMAIARETLARLQERK